MKTNLIILGAALVVAGCEVPPQKTAKADATVLEPSPAPLAAPELDPKNTEKVRVGEALKAYPSGRYVDPDDANVMHEAHTIYRRETPANWNLNPNAPTAVSLGPVLAIADPAASPNPLPAELEQKIAEQNQLMATLVEQNQALAAELAKLNHDMETLRGKQPGSEVKP